MYLSSLFWELGQTFFISFQRRQFHKEHFLHFVGDFEFLMKIFLCFSYVRINSREIRTIAVRAKTSACIISRDNFSSISQNFFFFSSRLLTVANKA